MIPYTIKNVYTFNNETDAVDIDVAIYKHVFDKNRNIKYKVVLCKNEQDQPLYLIIKINGNYLQVDRGRSIIRENSVDFFNNEDMMKKINEIFRSM